MCVQPAMEHVYLETQIQRTAFQLQRTCLRVQGEAAEVHVAHCCHCDPRSQKMRKVGFYEEQQRDNIITNKSFCSFRASNYA